MPVAIFTLISTTAAGSTCNMGCHRLPRWQPFVFTGRAQERWEDFHAPFKYEPPMTSGRPIAIVLIAWTEDSSVVILALASGNFLLYRTCLLSGAKQT